MIFESKVYVAFDQRGVAGIVVSQGARGRRVQARAFAALAPEALTVGAADDNLGRPQEVREALAHVHRELGGNGRRASLVLPEGLARLVLLEPPSGVEPAEFARFRLASGLPFTAGEALVDGIAAPPGRFLAAAVRRSVVRSYEAAAAAAGFSQERVLLMPLLALGSLLRRPEPARSVLAVVLGDAAFSLAYFDEGRLALIRNRRRDASVAQYRRERDEVVRTLALANASSAPRVVAFGADCAELAEALRRDGLEAVARLGAEPNRPASAWLEAALN